MPIDDSAALTRGGLLARRFSALSVVTKLSLVIGSVTIVTLAVFGILVGKTTTETLREDAVRDLTSQVDIVVNMMERTDENMRREAVETGKVFASHFTGAFNLVPGERQRVAESDTP